MKKLMTIAAAVLFTVTAASAQYRASTYGNKGYDTYASKGHSDNNDRNWGYDRGYNKSNSASGMINSFQREARESIASGIVNGSITSYEAKRLLEMAEKIEAKENRFMRNGRLTNNEVRELKEDLAVLNRIIVKEKRDNDRSNADVYGRAKRF